MRTYTSGGITITYPEQLVMVGDRNIVTITGATTKTTFSMFGDERELAAGAGEFDLLPYMQSLYATVAKNEKFSIASVVDVLLLDGVAFKSIDLTQVYFGASEFGDKRVLVQNAEYTEFSPWFDFWLPTDMEAKINGVEVDFVQGFNHVDLSSYTGDVVIQFAVDGFNEWDDTFDYTFTGEMVYIYIRRVECPQNGFLMRWLDHWGIWQQKTFALASTIRNADKSIYNWNGQATILLLNGLRFAEVKKALGVDIVEENCTLTEAKRLSDLAVSSYVHAYDFNNSAWIPVTVTNNDTKVAENKGRQNMNFNISLQNGY